MPRVSEILCLASSMMFDLKNELCAPCECGIHFIGDLTNLRVATSIAYDIMDHKKLERIRGEIARLRRGIPKRRELVALAQQLGRKESDRGKHPMFESEHFPNLFPLSIPAHKGRDIPNKTRNSILNQLEGDADAWEEALTRRGHGNGSNGTNGAKN
jgi:hypothetical protein